MTPRTSPTVRQRRLGGILRELRRRDGRTAAQVAAELGWARTTVTRLEEAPRKPQPKQITRLLDIYGVEEPQRSEILALVAEARQRGWWDTYRDSISATYDTYIGLEAEAAMVRTWEPVLVPGLLQTADYARALIRARRPGLADDDVEARVALRIRRQELLTNTADPLQLWAIMSEGALHRQVGGVEVMRGQIAHLLKMSELPNVNLQIFPFAAGAAPVVGPVAILQFRDPLDPEIVYTETAVGDAYIEDQRQVADVLASFIRLVRAALPVTASRRLIDTLV